MSGGCGGCGSLLLAALIADSTIPLRPALPLNSVLTLRVYRSWLVEKGHQCRAPCDFLAFSALCVLPACFKSSRVWCVIVRQHNAEHAVSRHFRSSVGSSSSEAQMLQVTTRPTRAWEFKLPRQFVYEIQFHSM